MTKIAAQVIADSENKFGQRIVTMQVTFPRIILAEFNTHRMFSRNSASSRAIPFSKMVKAIEENPFIPIAWQEDHKGMQGTVYIEDESDIKANISAWNNAKEEALHAAKGLAELDVTKQLCNRLLEPFMWHTVIVTATEWENFFALRCPQYTNFFQEEKKDRVYRSKKDLCKESGDVKPEDFTELEWLKRNSGKAEIHMMALAEAMWDAYNESTPKQLEEGEWHIPFADKIGQILPVSAGYEKEIEACIKIATVMCARVSYTVVGEDQKPLTYERMIQIHDELLAANPKHMSPFEHCARAMKPSEYTTCYFKGHACGDSESESKDGWSGNFRGFVQYRKMIQGENITL